MDCTAVDHVSVEYAVPVDVFAKIMGVLLVFERNHGYFMRVTTDVMKPT